MPLAHLRLLTVYLLVIAMPVYMHGQDTAFVYHIPSGTESFIILPTYDTTVVADSLPPHYGNYGVTAMPITKPVDTIKYSKISKPFAVPDSFPNFNFPFTAITSARYGHHITVAVIGRHALLVFNYDVYSTQWQSWRNPFSIDPFFNNGTIQFGHSQLTPIRYYALAPLSNWRNVSVIEVAEDIGIESGYFGLAYDTAHTRFLESEMLYNISYPSQGGPFVQNLYNDSIKGDTMYMRYGNSPEYTWYNGFYFEYGREGDYVSPLFDKNFQIRGMRWDYGNFPALDHQSFNFLKYVLQNLATDVDEVEANENDFTVYPNPSTGEFHVRGEGTFNVYDVTGKLLLSGNANKGFNLSTPGLYFVKNESNAVKKLVVTR